MGVAKLIFLAKRNRALSSEEFASRWRQHGAYAMSLPMWDHVLRYAQCRPIDSAALRHVYDAVGVVVYKSWDDLQSSRHPSKRVGLLDDELQTFSEHVRYGSVLADEHVVRSGRPGPIKVFVFSEQSDERLWQTMLDSDACRLVRNDVVRHEFLAGSRMKWNAIFEASFATRERLAVLEKALSAHARTDDSVLIVPAREAIVYDLEP